MRAARVAALAAVAAAVAALVAGAGGGVPQTRSFVPGERLGGVELGMSKREVRREWGDRFGVCRDCRHTTWYFNERPFAPEGTGVVFEGGRVARVFTVWQPEGWRTAEGLALGDPAADIARTYGPLDRRRCAGYYALVEESRETQTAYYVFEDEVWGFGLAPAGASACP